MVAPLGLLLLFNAASALLALPLTSRDQSQPLTSRLRSRRTRPRVSCIWSAAVPMPHRRLLNAMRERPLAAAFVTGVVKATAADWVVQRASLPRISYRRLGAFALFGLSYYGAIASLFYVSVCGRLFPEATRFPTQTFAKRLQDKRGQLAVLQQLALEQLCYIPLVYFPIFYVIGALVSSTPISTALVMWRENFVVDNLNALRFWVPAQLFNYSCLPIFYRVPYTNSIGFAWLILLSMLRGSAL